MPVSFAAPGKGAVVGIIVPGIEHSTRSAILRYTFPSQIGHVSAKRCSPPPVPYDARLDGDAARPVRHQPRGHDARSAATAESSAAAATSRSALQSTSLLGCRQRPRNERLGAMRAALPSVPDAPKPDMEIIVLDHGVHEVCAVVMLQGFARIGRLSCAVAPRARCLMCLNSSAARPSRSLRLLSCLRAVECSALPTSSTNARQHATRYERCSNRPSWPAVDWFHAECL